MTANYTLSHCYGSPDGFGGTTTNVSSGYNIPSNPDYDDGNCTADRLQNFTMTASVQSPHFEKRGAARSRSGWQLVGSFRALTGPWLTITTGADVRAERSGGHAAREPGVRRRTTPTSP